MTINFILALPIIIIVVCLMIRSRYLIIKVRGDSMFPSYLRGELLLVRRRWSSEKIRSGQVVIAENPVNRQLIVKRVTAVENDNILLEKRPHYTESPSTHHLIADSSRHNYYVIPKGYCYLEGDSLESVDSYHWGPIALNTIVGVVISKF